MGDPAGLVSSRAVEKNATRETSVTVRVVTRLRGKRSCRMDWAILRDYFELRVEWEGESMAAEEASEMSVLTRSINQAGDSKDPAGLVWRSGRSRIERERNLVRGWFHNSSGGGE